MFDFLVSESMEFALLGIAAAIAVVCAIITLLIENRQVEKLAEDAVEIELENDAEKLDRDYDSDDESHNYVRDVVHSEQAVTTLAKKQQVSQTKKNIKSEKAVDFVETKNQEVALDKEAVLAIANAELEQSEKELTKCEKGKQDKISIDKNEDTPTSDAKVSTSTKKAVVAKDKAELEFEAKIYGKYVINELSEEEFQFELYDNKEKLLFQSVKYSSSAVCKKNIGYFKKNVLLGEFTVEGTPQNGFSYVLKRGVVSYVGPIKKTSTAVEKAIESVKTFSQTDVIIA